MVDHCSLPAHDLGLAHDNLGGWGWQILNEFLNPLGDAQIQDVQSWALCIEASGLIAVLLSSLFPGLISDYILVACAPIQSARLTQLVE